MTSPENSLFEHFWGYNEASKILDIATSCALKHGSYTHLTPPIRPVKEGSSIAGGIGYDICFNSGDIQIRLRDVRALGNWGTYSGEWYDHTTRYVEILLNGEVVVKAKKGLGGEKGEFWYEEWYGLQGKAETVKETGWEIEKAGPLDILDKKLNEIAL